MPKSSLNAHGPGHLLLFLHRIVSATSLALFLLSSPSAALHARLKRDVFLLFLLFVFMFGQAERLAPLCNSRVTGDLPGGLSDAGRGEGLVRRYRRRSRGRVALEDARVEMPKMWIGPRYVDMRALIFLGC